MIHPIGSFQKVARIRSSSSVLEINEKRKHFHILIQKVQECILTYFCLSYLEKNKKRQMIDLEKFEKFSKNFFVFAKTATKEDTEKILKEYKKLPHGVKKEIKNEVYHVLSMNLLEDQLKDKNRFFKSIFLQDPFFKIIVNPCLEGEKQEKKEIPVLGIALGKVQEKLLFN